MKNKHPYRSLLCLNGDLPSRDFFEKYSNLPIIAALDFIDELKLMNPETVLIGQTTKADRLYMEVQSIPLPSRLGFFSFPIKVYRNRIRQDNEPYIPSIPLDTPDSEKLRAVIFAYLNPLIPC